MMNDQLDEKTLHILQLLEQGKTRDEIAQSFNIQWKSIDMYMRRRGFRWDKQAHCYTLHETSPSPSKVQSILQQFATKSPNFKKIAQQHGFQTVELMGQYMKKQGYTWHPELQNYYFVSSTHQEEDVSNFTEKTLMQFLLSNQHTLTKLITTSTFSLSTIITNEVTISLTSTLYESLQKASQTNNLTPQAIIELALIKYLTEEK